MSSDATKVKISEPISEEENCPNCGHDMLNDEGMMPGSCDLIECNGCGNKWFPSIIQEFNMLRGYTLEDAREAHQSGLENLKEKGRDFDDLEVVEA